MQTYSADSDITGKIAHVSLPEQLSVASFREEAFSHINSFLKNTYVIPLSGASEDDLLLLKHIEAGRAAGMCVFASTIGRDLEGSYGDVLIKASDKALESISSGKVFLSADRDTDKSDNLSIDSSLSTDSPDAFPTFARPHSGVENDAILGRLDSKEFSALNDTLSYDDTSDRDGGS